MLQEYGEGPQLGSQVEHQIQQNKRTQDIYILVVHSVFWRISLERVCRLLRELREREVTQRWRCVGPCFGESWAVPVRGVHKFSLTLSVCILTMSSGSASKKQLWRKTFWVPLWRPKLDVHQAALGTHGPGVRRRLKSGRVGAWVLGFKYPI